MKHCCLKREQQSIIVFVSLWLVLGYHKFLFSVKSVGFCREIMCRLVEKPEADLRLCFPVMHYGA